MTAHQRRAGDEARLRGLFRYGRPGTIGASTAELGVELSRGVLEFLLTVSDTGFDSTPYGSHRASVYVLAAATVVHVPDESGGVVATFDPNATGAAIDALLARVREVGR